VTQPTVWLTDDPCPVCAAGLVLLGHGGPVQVIECRACGYSDRWEFADDGFEGGAG
jgi:Zn ribbon nucleic-acid-binding protein